MAGSPTSRGRCRSRWSATISTTGARHPRRVRKHDQASAHRPWQDGPMITSADRLQWLLDIVERSLAQPEMRGEALAQRAHRSRFHFDRLVAAALGEAPGALRRRLLLE